MSRPSVLDANLELLLSRAYVPVRPSPGFRARLTATLAAELARSREARSPWRVSALRAAAALLVVGLLASLAWLAFGRQPSAPTDLDALARECGAVRVDSGAWRAVSRDELAAGVERTGSVLDVVAPERATLRVWFGSRGRLDAAAASRVRIVDDVVAHAAHAPREPAVGPQDALADASAGDAATRAQGAREDGEGLARGHASGVASSRTTEIVLERGGFGLERYDSGAAWTITTPEGRLFLERGSIAIACLAPAGGPVRVSARLVAGAASLSTPDGAIALEIGREAFLEDGALVAALDPSSPRGERTSVTSASGASATTEAPAPAIAPARVVLRGRVRAPRGEPLAPGGSITLLREVRLPAVAEPEKHALSSDGAFAIEDILPGIYTVFVEAPDHAVWQRAGVALTAPEVRLDVELDPGVLLRGRVVDLATRAPIAGAIVVSENDVAVQVLPYFFETEPRGAAFAVSASDGRFELAHASRGPHVLRATRGGHAAGWSEKVDLTRKTDVGELEIALARGGSITGLVADDADRPIAGALVIASRVEYATPRPRLSYSHALTDAEGRYRVDDLAAGFYVVLRPVPDPSDPTAQSRVFEVRVEAGGTLELDMTATRRGAELVGTVLTHQGVPIADHDVTLMPVGGAPGSARWQADRSRADGGFRFVDVKPGRYGVYVGRGIGTHFVLAGAIDVPAVPRVVQEFRTGVCSIRGRVAAAATASALAEPWVVVEVGRDGVWDFVGRTQGDALGVFLLDGLVAGDYRVTAYASSGRYGADGVVTTLSAAAPEAEVEIALARGAALQVRVRAPGGEPVEGALVRIVPAAGETISYSSDDRTGPDGALAIDGIRPGRFDVLIEHAQGRASAVVDLAPDDERTLDLVLAPEAPRASR